MARGIQASQREWLVGGWVGGSCVRVPVLMWVSVCVCVCVCVVSINSLPYMYLIFMR